MSEWISVKDRMPKNKQIVDIWRDGERLCNYEIFKDYKGQKGNTFFEPIEFGVCCVRNATHWMPLPEPPK